MSSKTASAENSAAAAWSSPVTSAAFSRRAVAVQ
jgi:hypothetical protein